MTADNRTIEDRLTAAGYGHRRDEKSVSDGRHTVFRMTTGEVVGRFDAFDALAIATTAAKEDRK